MAELKPCPFCGGEMGVMCVSYPDRKRYTPACMNKVCQGHSGNIWPLFDTFGKAVKGWNQGVENA